MIRVVQIAVLTFFCFVLMSCPDKPDNNFPGNLKINDLGPKNPDGSTEINKLKTINLDLHVLEIPEENFVKLNEIRRALSIKPLKFNNYLSFSDSSFSAYYGRNQTLSTVLDLLKIAGAQTVTTMTITLPDGESDNILIKQLPQMQTVSYSSLSGEHEAARVGPGILAMHVTVEKTDSFDNAAAVTIFPLFTLMSSNTITELSLRNKLRDFPFTSVALRLDMTPGDFIFMAPERHISDQTTLCGLFFSNPYGSTFFNFDEKKLPEKKPSIRVYLLTCVGLNL